MIDFVSIFCTYTICKVYCGICSNSMEKVSSFIMIINILILLCSWVSTEIVDKHFLTTQKSNSLLVPGEFLLLQTHL